MTDGTFGGGEGFRFVMGWDTQKAFGRVAGIEPMNDDKPGSKMEALSPRSGNKKNSAKLSRDVQAKLGQQLRAVYDDVVSQGVPDRFAELLSRLDDSSKKDKA